MIKQIIAIILILILSINLLGVIIGKISITMFWLILLTIIVITYLFFPKEESKKYKK